MNPVAKKILFLYSELAGYMVACFNQLALQEDIELHIVHWPLNAEAPFRFRLSDKIRCYDRSGLTAAALEQLAEEIQPHHILVSGWIDKGYLALCKKWKGRVPVTGTMDTPWKGSWRQRIACLAGAWTVRNWFDMMWVTGAPQEGYAHRLGFDENAVFTGFYSADTSLFGQHFHSIGKGEAKPFPKRFLYAGRYAEEKGLAELWRAFMLLDDPEWELLCLGTGELEAEKPNHPRIGHAGFVQPQDMEDYLKHGGIFVLPSR
ncbi:MAG: glycosyltransferase, partial [Cytophagales bacterium]|nr:glycosyltransferase [Cytophagales bacterium]